MEKEKKKATLYNRKKAIAKVMIQDKKMVELVSVIREDLLPIPLQVMPNTNTLLAWQKRRLLPCDEEDGIIRAGLPIALNDFPGFIDYGNMFSLSDQYWVKSDFATSWENGNFFDNGYDETIGNIFFTPWLVGDDYKKHPSPDVTTNGRVKKRWVRENGCDYLLKAAYRDQDPISEILASITLKQLGVIPFVPYQLDIHGLEVVSKCQNFITRDTEFVPAIHMYLGRDSSSHPAERMIRIAEKKGIANASSFIEAMIFVDYIMLNHDRNLGNFGFIRDARTGEFLSFAPLFDFGKSYMSKRSRSNTFFHAEEKEIIHRFLKERGPLQIDFEEHISVLKSYMRIQKEKKDRMLAILQMQEKELKKMCQKVT